MGTFDWFKAVRASVTSDMAADRKRQAKDIRRLTRTVEGLRYRLKGDYRPERLKALNHVAGCEKAAPVPALLR